MASIHPTRANASCFLVDGVAADDTVEVARRRDILAKRARDEDLRQEADARGWSSAIPDRSVALRHRHGLAFPPFARATTSVAVPEEQRCSGDVASSAVIPIEPQAEGIATFMGSDLWE